MDAGGVPVPPRRKGEGTGEEGEEREDRQQAMLIHVKPVCFVSDPFCSPVA